MTPGVVDLPREAGEERIDMDLLDSGCALDRGELLLGLRWSAENGDGLRAEAAELWGRDTKTLGDVGQADRRYICQHRC